MSLTNLKANSLAPSSNYSKSVKTTVTAFQKINISEEQILKINVSSSSTVPRLHQHLQNAQGIAKNWEQSIKPKIVNNLKNVSNFTALFNNLYGDLSTNATAIQANAGDKTAITNFKTDINHLQASTKIIFKETVAMQSVLSSFKTDIDGVVRDFQSDMKAVQSKLSADNAELQTYHNQMSYLEQKLADAKAKKEEMTSWWMTALTFGLSQLVALIEDLEGQVNSLNQRIGNIQSQINQDNREVNILSGIANTLATLVGLSTTLQGMVMAFISNWQALSDNLNELEGMEGISATDGWAKSDLQAVNSEWQVITTEVNSI